ncbi:hypothetical protein KFE98_09350 [bacterium SCSIO 12741]|nr:hypothetical protein KFE98_09350 [bacterium SCSIO 12741]
MKKPTTNRLLPVALFLVLTGLIWPWSSKAGDELLVEFEELTFNSIGEKNVFTRIDNDEEVDWLEVFVYATRSSSKGVYLEIKREVRDHLATLESRHKLSKKKPAKKVATVYDYVNDNLLSKYELHNEFTEIFGEGKFNCVSGTALYAILFERLGMKTSILEQPNHVYLIVLPETEAIEVESTNRLSGLSYYDQQDVAAFVENLVKFKYEPEESLETESYNELFERYYFRDKGITIQELAGIQYGNVANYNYRKGDFKEALNYYRKAWYLYPSFRFQVMIYDCLAKQVKPERYKKGSKRYLNDLVTLANHGPKDSEVYLEYVYTHLGDQLTIEETRMEEFDTLSQNLLRRLTDLEMVESTTFFYYLFKANYALEDLSYSPEIEQMVYDAYKMRPENRFVQDLAFNLVVQQITDARRADSALAIVERANEHFSHFEESNRYQILECGVMLFVALEHYRYQKGSLGEEYLKKFEAYPESVLKEINGELIDETYGEAASYYFKRGQKTRSRQVVERGLKVNPDSYELKTRLRMLSY